MKRKSIHCPKCRKPPIRLLEMWSNHSIEFGTDEKTGLWDGSNGIMDIGDATHVIAECICGYSWRLRGVLQITDIEAKLQ